MQNIALTIGACVTELTRAVPFNSANLHFVYDFATEDI